MTRHLARLVTLASVGTAYLALTGCDSSTTDTGYKPRHLGMGGTELRALYAPAFSPEAAAAGAGEKKDSALGRPSIGPGLH